VSRVLSKGDTVGAFEVLEAPGHTPGASASWRDRDRVLVCGDVLANFGLHPDRPRLVLPPAASSYDGAENRRSAKCLANLRPQLVCSGHGFAMKDPGRFADSIDRPTPVRRRSANTASRAQWTTDGETHCGKIP
jgi:glyoxylase-like metal-dependent hydrolase (beta-lactamase superfamily II)